MQVLVQKKKEDSMVMGIYARKFNSPGGVPSVKCSCCHRSHRDGTLSLATPGY